MARPTPFLWFDGTAEQAAERYVRIFPNSSVGDVARYGEGGLGPAGSAMTVSFELDGQSFVGLNGGPQFPFTEAVSFAIPCADQAEVDHYWDALVDGGETGRCGWLKDRFGVSWQVVPNRLGELLGDPDPDRASRAMEAMLGMSRLVIADLETAADG